MVIGRLFNLQLSSNAHYIDSVKNASLEITLYPDRGIIYDRKGKLLVYNDVVYDLAVIRSKISKTLDTAALLKIIQLDTLTFKKKLAKIRNGNVPNTFLKDLPPEIYIPLQENILRFPRFHC